MVSVLSLWLPILLSAVLVFVASSVFHGGRYVWLALAVTAAPG